MRYRKTCSLEIAASKAGMSENTARRYFKQGGAALIIKERDYRTRRDPFAGVWDQLQEMLTRDEGL